MSNDGDKAGIMQADIPSRCDDDDDDEESRSTANTDRAACEHPGNYTCENGALASYYCPPTTHLSAGSSHSMYQDPTIRHGETGSACLGWQDMHHWGWGPG
nr:hypothetical protein CFP56_33552 [Quercus suber]